MRTWDSDDPNDPQSDIRVSVNIEVNRSYSEGIFKVSLQEGGRFSLNDVQAMVDRITREVKRKVEQQIEEAKTACIARRKKKEEEATA